MVSDISKLCVLPGERDLLFSEALYLLSCVHYFSALP